MAPKILITDDDELMLISVEGLLESKGYAVDTASSGKEALEKAASESYDLFVLDIVMPVMSGFAVLESLRKMEAYDTTPIVMLSAKSGEADREKGKHLGATRFLPKPIEPEKLIEALEELLP